MAVFLAFTLPEWLKQYYHARATALPQDRHENPLA
jgi:hypothetical protein